MLPGCNVLNSAKPLSGIVYLHIALSGYENIIVRLFTSLKKMIKPKRPVRILESIHLECTFCNV